LDLLAGLHRSLAAPNAADGYGETQGRVWSIINTITNRITATDIASMVICIFIQQDCVKSICWAV
jgi:hypothetical protein